MSRPLLLAVLAALAAGTAMAGPGSLRQLYNRDNVSYRFSRDCGCGTTTGVIGSNSGQVWQDSCDAWNTCKLVIDGVGTVTQTKDDRRNIVIEKGAVSLQ